MKHAWSMGIVLAAALALAAGGVVLAARSHREDGERQAAAAAELTIRLEAAEKGRAALESRVDSLEKRIEALAGETGSSPRPVGARAKESSISVVTGEPREEEPPPPGGESDAAARAPANTDLERILGALLDPAGSSSRKQATWREAAKLGLIDDVLAAFERRAEENPGDARAHADLGVAYLQKLNGVSEMEKGTWAMRADRAFDAALAIDPANWEARFTKALALSYWPAITGKQPESIRQFETLIAEQESAAARPEHAKSYLYLGNLYLGQGKEEKAREVWRRGASLFPADRELASRLEAAEAEPGPEGK
jgi:tetratricopeptide (TPR) repeat protein